LRSSGGLSSVKYHYPHRRFTNRMDRERGAARLDPCGPPGDLLVRGVVRLPRPPPLSPPPGCERGGEAWGRGPLSANHATPVRDASQLGPVPQTRKQAGVGRNIVLPSLHPKPGGGREKHHQNETPTRVRNSVRGVLSTPASVETSGDPTGGAAVTTPIPPVCLRDTC